VFWKDILTLDLTWMYCSRSLWAQGLRRLLWDLEQGWVIRQWGEGSASTYLMCSVKEKERTTFCSKSNDIFNL